MQKLALALVLAVLALTGCASSSKTSTVKALRIALDEGDYETARTYLIDEPRVWYEKHAGSGSLWEPGAERWAAWDEEFNSVSTIGSWHKEGPAVWAIATEMNDYYRLIERQGSSKHRLTYFFDESGKIQGYMISDADPENPTPPAPSRFDEFETWVKAKHPMEWAYLRPGGQLDPTGNRAERTRHVLNLWRAEVGLPVIE